jgi:hypothetical protein
MEKFTELPLAELFGDDNASMRSPGDIPHMSQ